MSNAFNLNHNDYAQYIMGSALMLHPGENIYDMISIIKSFSHSGNNVPGFRGKGLEEAIAISEMIVNHHQYSTNYDDLVRVLAKKLFKFNSINRYLHLNKGR